MQKSKLTLVTLTLAGLMITASPALAHVVVKPSQAGIGSFTDFTIGVPSEKEDVSSVGVKLTLPEGLNNVSPVVKPGWKIEVKTSTANSQPDDDGNLKPVPTEIDWTGGIIPAGQKDFFEFSAQVPSKEVELDWKVVQTYSDGSTISWTLGPKDAQPKDDQGKSDYSKFGPYSKTMVINDLKPSPAPSTNGPTALTQSYNLTKWPFVLSLAALGLALASLVMQFRK